MIPPVSFINSSRDHLWYRQKGKREALVAKAIKEGRLKRQPCIICGLENAEAHHPDYSKILEVVFLCPVHHLKFHSFLRKEFARLKRRRYTHAFHDQVLVQFISGKGAK